MLQIVNPADDSIIASFDNTAPLIGELATKLGFVLSDTLPQDYLTVNFVGASLVEQLHALFSRIDALYPPSARVVVSEKPLSEVDPNLLKHYPHTSLTRNGIAIEHIEQTVFEPNAEGAALRAGVGTLVAFFEQANNHILKNSDYQARPAAAAAAAEETAAAAVVPVA